MAGKTAIAVSDAAYLAPLLQGLAGAASPFDLKIDIPAKNALKLIECVENIRCAFLSPIDYARHGGEYQIVPDIGVSSSRRTNTIQLFVNSDARNIRSIAVDVEVTSEIILAKIILIEKFRNLSLKEGSVQFIPMLPDVEAMLTKADAALVVNTKPTVSKTGFVLDLVEEWNDLTDLPYVHGFWVARDGDLSVPEIRQLVDSRNIGVHALKRIATDKAIQLGLPDDILKTYLSAFSYNLGQSELDSISEFFRYSFYHGVLRDIPDLNFFDLPMMDPGSVN